MEGMQYPGHPQPYPSPSQRTYALQPGPGMAPGPVMHGAPGPVMHGAPGPVMHGAHPMQAPMAQMPMAQMPMAQMSMPGPAGTQAYQVARHSMPTMPYNQAVGLDLNRDGRADLIVAGPCGNVHDGTTQGGIVYAAAQGGVYASTPAPYELEQAPQEEPQFQEEEEPLRVSMVVPEGATPGTKLQYAAPDGQELRLTVPEGVPPGSVMNLTQDPITKQWKCMAEPIDAPEAAPGPMPDPPSERVTYTQGAPRIASHPAGQGPMHVPRTYVQQPMTVNLSYVPPPVPGNASLTMAPGQVLGPADLVNDPARFNPPRQMPGYPGGEMILDQRPSYTPPPVTLMAQRPSYTPLPAETAGSPPMQMILGPHGEMGLMASTARVQPQQLPPHVVLNQTPSYVPPPVTTMQNSPSYVPPVAGMQGTQMAFAHEGVQMHAQGAPVMMLPPQHVTAPGQPPMPMMGPPMPGMPPPGMVGAPPMMSMGHAAMPNMPPIGLPPVGPPQIGPPPPMGQHMTGPGHMMQGHPAPLAYMGPPMGQVAMAMHHQLPPGMVPYGGPMPQQMQMMRPGPPPPEGMEGMPMQGMMHQPTQG